MLESPDYFFRVREIGRLRQTMCVCLSHLTSRMSNRAINERAYSVACERQKICGDLPETTAFKSYAATVVPPTVPEVHNTRTILFAAEVVL